MILYPRLYLDQHQNVTISRGSPAAHAYHVWWTTVNMFVSYPAHRLTDRMINTQTNSNDDITRPWWSNYGWRSY